MERPVTVGLDGSAEARAAAEWAAGEARWRGLPLRLLYAGGSVPFGDPPVPEPLMRRSWPQWMLYETATALRARFPSLPITSDQVDERPVAALVAAADQAELLALGSQGLGALGGFFTGSVAFGVLARTQRPVVLVRADGQDEDEVRSQAAPSGIILGVDLAHPCDPVIDFAFSCAAGRGEPLHAVHAWRRAPVYGTAGALDPHSEGALETAEGDALATALRAWQEKYPDVDLHQETFAGHAVERLVHLASTASLLVLGRRTTRPGLGPRIGAVTHAAIHHARCPVAVIAHD